VGLLLTRGGLTFIEGRDVKDEAQHYDDGTAGRFCKSHLVPSSSLIHAKVENGRFSRCPARRRDEMFVLNCKSEQDTKKNRRRDNEALYAPCLDGEPSRAAAHC
jgi:hypothetical protein